MGLRLTAVIVSLVVVACTASTGEEVDADVPLSLDGTFTTEAGDAEIELHAPMYRLRAEGCQDKDCEEVGSFTFDATTQILSLAAPGKPPYAMPLEVEEADAPADVEEESTTAIHIKELLPGPKSPLIQKRVRLIRRAKFAKKPYVRQTGTCSASQIGQAQNSCRSDRCPALGKTSRGVNFCSSSGGKVSFSCACAGTAAPAHACVSAQREYARCMANAIGCQTIVNCRGTFNSDTGDIDGCTRPNVHDICRGI